MIWFNPPDLAVINARGQDTLASHLHIIFTEAGDDYLVATMPVDERTCQPMGIINGGASCALAETVASTAANFVVDQTQRYCLGLDIMANHLRPAFKGGHVKAIARPIHLGRKTHVWNVDLYNDENKHTCAVRMTMAVLQRDTQNQPVDTRS